MIEKERLEKLLKEHKVVYSIDTKCYCIDILDLHNNMFKIDYDDYGNAKLFTRGDWWHWFNLKDLFETKEEAEFALKYQNIARTETLSLPTWEQVEEKYCDSFGDIRLFNKYGIEIIYWKFETDKNTFEIRFYDNSIKEYKANKKGWLFVCELCKKLFLGEETK